jgi:hypothetical protein
MTPDSQAATAAVSSSNMTPEPVSQGGRLLK